MAANLFGGQMSHSLGFLEKAFLFMVGIFVSLSSMTFFILYHQHHNIKIMKRKIDLVSDISDRQHIFGRRGVGFDDHRLDLGVVGIKTFKKPEKVQPKSPSKTAALQPSQKPETKARNMSFGQYMSILRDIEMSHTKLNIPVKLSQTGLAVRMENPTSRKRGEDNVIRILSWTWRYPFQREWFNKRKLAFSSCRLPDSYKCEYTTDVRMYAVSDVILFRMRMLKNSTIPSYRFPHQKWILVENEPPTHLRNFLDIEEKKKKLLGHAFNLTSTYLNQSEIPLSLQVRCTLNHDNFKRFAKTDFVGNKYSERPVAIWTNVCESYSKREHYLRELDKFISVDVYGGCGSRACSMIEKHNSKNQDEFTCFLALLNTTYKFVLSFEDTFCKGFISDTLWSIYKARVKAIPVVLGVGEYYRYLPKSTYIDVRDFKSPEELGAELSMLNGRKDLANQKLRRKLSLDCAAPKSEAYKCRLCRYLHNTKRQVTVAKDVFEEWNEDNQCLKPEDFFSKFLRKYPFAE